MHEAVCAAAGIHALRDMTSMSSLSLAHSQVTDEGLAHIRGACADHAPPLATQSRMLQHPAAC